MSKNNNYVIIKGKKVKRSWLVGLLLRPPTKTELLSIYSPKDILYVVLRHLLWYHKKRDVLPRACAHIKYNKIRDETFSIY